MEQSQGRLSPGRGGNSSPAGTRGLFFDFLSHARSALYLIENADSTNRAEP
jgi:hypothetical protein